LKIRIVLIAFAVAVVSITLFVFFFGKQTFEAPNFTVPSQRVETGRSAALTEKWDGIGKIADMIWE
jgi:Na+/proline symporter